MTLKEAAELLLSVKSKRKGIDKETKDKIKELEKVGNFDTDMLENPFHVVRTGNSILTMKENDFFDPKEIGRLFLSDAIKNADGSLIVDIYKTAIETAFNDFGNEYYAGLGDKEWGMELLENALKNIDMQGSDMLWFAEFLESDANDKELSKEIAIKAGTKAANMGQIADIANFLADKLNEVDAGKKVIEDAKNNNLEYFNEDKSDLDYISDSLK